MPRAIQEPVIRAYRVALWGIVGGIVLIVTLVVEIANYGATPKSIHWKIENGLLGVQAVRRWDWYSISKLDTAGARQVDFLAEPTMRARPKVVPPQYVYVCGNRSRDRVNVAPPGGSSTFGFQSGWYVLDDGRDVELYLTRERWAVLIPRGEWVRPLLVGTEDPHALITALRAEHVAFVPEPKPLIPDDGLPKLRDRIPPTGTNHGPLTWRVSRGVLHIDVYGAHPAFPLSKLAISGINAVDFDTDFNLRPWRASSGVDDGWYRTGRFQLSDSREVELYLARESKAVYIPRWGTIALMVGTDEPDKLMAALRAGGK